MGSHRRFGFPVHVAIEERFILSRVGIYLARHHLHDGRVDHLQVEIENMTRSVILIFTGWSISPQSWVGLTWIYDDTLSCPAAQPLLPTSHQPKQNQAEGGTAKIKVNPTQVHQEMCHPV